MHGEVFTIVLRLLEGAQDGGWAMDVVSIFGMIDAAYVINPQGDLPPS